MTGKFWHRSEQQNKRSGDGERGRGAKGCRGATRQPESAGADACNKRRDADSHIADGECCAPYLTGRRIGDNRREEALNEAHLETPQRGSDGGQPDRLRKDKCEIGSDQNSHPNTKLQPSADPIR